MRILETIWTSNSPRKLLYMKILFNSNVLIIKNYSPFVRRKLIAFKVALKGEQRLREEFIYVT